MKTSFSLFRCAKYLYSMSDSKIQLSADEMLLVQDSHWILTKHRVIEKVYNMFGQLSQQMQAYLQDQPHTLPVEALEISPKISKGEQYEKMPYVMLDYPRFFSKSNVLAIRTFFWWGHYFSCTLHLKGAFAQLFNRQINGALQQTEFENYYLSVNGNEFNFDLGHEDYTIIKNGAIYQLTEETSFIKISYRHPLADWNSGTEKLMEAFKRFIAIAY